MDTEICAKVQFVKDVFFPASKNVNHNNSIYCVANTVPWHAYYC